MKVSRTQPIADDDARTLTLDGAPLLGREGEPAAVALLAAGVDVFARSIKYHRARGPFCMEGRCEGCLMRVDGVPNVPTCQVPVREGLCLERQNAFPSAQVDFLSAIDWFFPSGIAHHEFMASLPGPLNRAMQRIARRVGGLGELPVGAPAEIPAIRRSRVDVLVVGGGAAGLGAAEAAARAGRRVVLVEEDRRPGGQLSFDPRHVEVGPARGPGPDVAARLTDHALAAGAELRCGTFVAALYAPGTAVLAMRDGVEIAEVKDLVLCSGTHPQPMLYEGNDLPGNLAARAVLRLLAAGLRPASRAVVVGDDPLGPVVAQALTASGTHTVELGTADRIVRARGDHAVSSVHVERAGTPSRLACDLVVVAAPPAPAFELAAQAGCEVAFRADLGGFSPVCDASGAARAPHVRVAGRLAGALGAAEAHAMGRRAAGGLS